MDVTAEGDQSARPASATALPVNSLLWFGGLLIALFAPVLYVMVAEWATESSMGHGFFVPVVAGYIAWQRREQILATPVKPHWSGYLFIFWGFAQLMAGTLGADLFMMRMGFLIALLGVIVALCGYAVVRVLAFPLALLLFMIRIPGFIYGQITFPLQILASTLAEMALSLLGIPVLREGNVLELASQKLSVVEACSGIRSLLSLTFLSLVYGYFFERRTWMRVALLIATIPIAIAANASRITITGIVSEWNKSFAEGFYHFLEGWVIFMVALAALLITHRILLWIAAWMERGKPAHA